MSISATAKINYKGFELKLLGLYEVTYHREREFGSVERNLVIESFKQLDCFCKCAGVVHALRTQSIDEVAHCESVSVEQLTTDIEYQLEEDRNKAELVEMRIEDERSAARIASIDMKPVNTVRQEMETGVYFVSHELHQNGWLIYEIREESTGKSINLAELCKREKQSHISMQCYLLQDCPDDNEQFTEDQFAALPDEDIGILVEQAVLDIRARQKSKARD